MTTDERRPHRIWSWKDISGKNVRRLRAKIRAYKLLLLYNIFFASLLNALKHIFRLSLPEEVRSFRKWLTHSLHDGVPSSDHRRMETTEWSGWVLVSDDDDW